MNLISKFLFLILFGISPNGFSQNINKSGKENLALKGYDTVSYFEDSTAVEGNKKFEFEYLGAKWRFVSAEHLELFKKSPEKYAPQYGPRPAAAGRASPRRKPARKLPGVADPAAAAGAAADEEPGHDHRRRVRLLHQRKPAA